MSKNHLYLAIGIISAGLSACVEGAPEAREGLRVDGGFVPGTTLRVLGGGFRDEEGGLAVDFV